MANDALAAAPLWRREPFRIFFPLGVALTIGGIGHWLLHALRLIPDYRPIFHAMTQVQGFLTCMAVGFLFTMVPRRTQSAPPATWQIAVCLIAPPVTVVAAWYRSWRVAQLAWLATALVVLAFCLARFHGGGAGRRPPVGFVWISLGLLMGVSGTALSLVYGRLDPALAWLHTIASGLVLQGMFLGFVLGAGSLALPLMTRDGAPPDAGDGRHDAAGLAGHLVAALLLVGSFWLEATTSLRLGVALRCTVVLAVYLFGIGMWRRPTRPGWNARAIWLAAWLVPLGYLLAALDPGDALAGLHVTFIGGFALLAMLISIQVTVGHGGYVELRLGRPWAVPWIFALALGAIGFRAAMELDPRRFFPWMAAAALCFLAALAMWALFVVPKLLRAP